MFVPVRKWSRAILFCLTLSALAQMPDNLKPPGEAVLIFKGLARGVQIYTCKPDGTWSSPATPDAILLDAQGTIQMHHYKGPAWETADGSKVMGVLPPLATFTPDANAIPWLLLKASGTGKLAGVQFVQRMDTEGGKPPAARDASHAGTEARVDYKATYYFYAAPK
jgi:Protein of unknown function (DUF3455)